MIFFPEYFFIFRILRTAAAQLDKWLLKNVALERFTAEKTSRGEAKRTKRGLQRFILKRIEGEKNYNKITEVKRFVDNLPETVATTASRMTSRLFPMADTRPTPF